MKAFVKEDSFYLKKNILYNIHQEILDYLPWTKDTFYVKHEKGTTSVNRNDLIFIDELREEKLNRLLND